MIFAFYGSYTLASFEEIPPGAEEMMKWRQAILDAGLQYLIAALADEVVC
jgi:L-amino acid N-acyltransferase YncA